MAATRDAFRRSTDPTWKPAQGNREFCLEPVDDVEPKQDGNMESSFLHRDLLILVDLVRINHVEQRADLSVGDHVLIIGPPGSRSCRLSGGILHQLTDLFFHRHTLQKRFHPRIEIGVGYAGRSHQRGRRRCHLGKRGTAQDHDECAARSMRPPTLAWRDRVLRCDRGAGVVLEIENGMGSYLRWPRVQVATKSG
jgi:hypothetical protein